MTETSHRQKDIDYHNQIGDEYHEVVVDPRKFPNDLLFQDISAQIHGGASMLDLGCGTGHMILRFGARFQSVVGVDHSSLMLSEARRRCAASKIEAEFVESDLQRFIDGDDGNWDLITCVGCLHHLEIDAVAPVIAQISELLAAGGQLVFAEPVAVDPGTEPEAIRKWNAKSVTRCKMYRQSIPEPDEAPIDLSLLTRAFEDSALEVVSQKRGWEILPRHVPASWWDRFAIRRLQQKYGANGIVYAVLLTKR